MTIFQGSASLTGAGALASVAEWVDSDFGPESFSGAGAFMSVGTRPPRVDSGPEVFSGAGALNASAVWIDVDSGPEIFAGGGPSRARTNLFTQSNNFSAIPWMPVWCFVGANATTDPQGGSNGSSLVELASGNVEHYLDQIVSGLIPGVPYTRSIYVKGGLGKTYISFKIFSNPGTLNAFWARFNLVTGLFDFVTDFGSPLGVSISAVNAGGGWWRVSQTFTLGSDSSAYIRVALLPNSGFTTNNGLTDPYVGDGVSGVYLFGAQLEQGNVSTTYIPTTTAPGTMLDGSDFVAPATRITYDGAAFAGGSGLIANSVSYRGFFQGQGALSVKTIQRAALNFTAYGAGSMLEKTTLHAAPTIILPGQGDLDCSASVLVVWKGTTDIEPATQMSGAELKEADNIAQQILTALLGAAGTRSGLPGSTMASTIYAAQLGASENIEDLVFAPVLLGCFETVRLASASYESMDVVRVLAASFTPLFPTGKWLAFLAEKFCLTEQAQILANTVFNCRATIDHYIDQVNAAFLTAEDQAADEQDNVSYIALIQTHGAIVNDLNARERALPQMIEYILPRPMPLLWIAQRIGGNASTFQTVYNENQPINPLFMPSPVKCFIASITTAQP